MDRNSSGLREFLNASRYVGMVRKELRRKSVATARYPEVKAFAT